MKKKILSYSLLMMLFFSSCSSDSEDSQNDASSGRYIHWTRYEMTTDDQFSRSARLVKDGKIYSSPYSYSADGGITWTTDPSDGLGRQFINLNGEFWVESSNTSSSTKRYTTLNGSATLNFDVNSVTGNVAWEGGTTAYTYLNNAGSSYGGNWDNDYVLITTNSGSTWSPILFQPPHNGQTGSIEKVWLIDSKLYVLSRIIDSVNGFTNFQLHVSNGDSWISSPVYQQNMNLTKVTGHGLFVTINGGTYRFVFNGPNFSFQDLEFDDDFNDSTNTSGQLLNAGGKLLLATEFKVFIPGSNDRLYNPSPSDGPNSLPGTQGIVVFGDELIVTRGWYVYKTPLPFVFHNTP